MNLPGVVSTLFRVVCVLLAIHGALVHAQTPVWHSGFEHGFPGGEWLDYDNGSYAPSGAMPAGRVSAWTIVDRASGAPVYSGGSAYKGWIAGRSDESHRAYPGVHLDIATPLVNTFMVYLDTDHARMSRTDWIHFGTWGNHDGESKSGSWALHTASVRNGKLEFAHVDPFHGEYIGPGTQPDFPLRRWVRLTVYLVYAGTTGFVQLWQDGAPTLRARITGLGKSPGTRLRTAHWGMYASGAVEAAVQYNDDISICTLAEPLTDLVREPRCDPAPELPAAPRR